MYNRTIFFKSNVLCSRGLMNLDIVKKKKEHQKKRKKKKKKMC